MSELVPQLLIGAGVLAGVMAAIKKELFDLVHAAWLAKDESWAIVTSATKADTQAKDGIAPDDRVSVIDLTSKPPKITQSRNAGLGATTVRISPDETRRSPSHATAAPSWCRAWQIARSTCSAGTATN